MAIVVSLLSAVSLQAAERPPFVPAAANSTCATVQAIGALFAQSREIEIEYICKSSGRLAKGMMGGAIQPDYYLSANWAWMDRVIQRGVVHPATVISPWGNRLVVAAPEDSSHQLDSLAALRSDTVDRVMIGDPSTAPFGRYSKQALVAAGVWQEVRDKVATRKHITLLADDLAMEPATSVGLLFSTNVKPPLKTVLDIPLTLHQPIRYYGAPVNRSGYGKEAAEFGKFMLSEAALEVAAGNGFVVVR